MKTKATTSARNRSTKPASKSSFGGKSTTLKQIVSSTNRWRDSYNPLRGLTIARGGALIEAYRRGEYADPLWTMHVIEEMDPDLIALIERTTSAMGQLDWDIKTVDEDERGSDFDQALADSQVGELRQAYDKIENLYDAIEHFAMARYWGFSIAQPHRRDDAGNSFATYDAPNWMECLDPWNIVRDGQYGSFFWNPEARSTSAIGLGDAARINLADVIVRTRKRPIDIFALLKFIRSQLSEKDWDAFIEMYGIPKWLIIGPPDIADDKLTEFQTAAEDLSEGGGGALPHGSEARSPEGVRGSSPFKQRLDHLSEKLVLAGTGGMLTMLTQSGSGTLAGSAHQETFEIIARFEARKISELMQRQFDRRILQLKFPGRPILAYWELAAREEQDIGAILDHAVKARSAGYIIDQAQLEEDTGYKFNVSPVPDSTGGASPGGVIPFRRQGSLLNRASPKVTELLAATRMDLPEAQHKSLEKIATAFLDIYRRAESEKWSPEKAAQELKALHAKLPEILLEMNVDPPTGKILAEAMATAFGIGVEAEAAQTGGAS